MIIDNNLFQLLSSFLHLNSNSDMASCNLIKMSPILFIFQRTDWLKIYKFTNLEDAHLHFDFRLTTTFILKLWSALDYFKMEFLGLLKKEHVKIPKVN